MPRTNTESVDPRLQKLQMLGGLQQLDGGAGGDDTASLVKMLGELYGIHEKQQKGPLEDAMMQAHTNYYNAQSDERPEERTARAMALELGGLNKAFAYDSTNPEYHSARKSVLSKYGYNFDGPTKAKPPDAFGEGAPPTKPASTSKFAALGPALAEDYKGAHNAIGVPIYNWLAEKTGMTPATPYTMPKDYNFWLPQRRKPAVAGATP